MKEQVKLEQQATLMMIDPYHALRTFFMFVQVVTGWFSVTIEVFLRYDFGERYLGWLRLYLSYLLLTLFVFFNALAQNLGALSLSMLSAFVIASLVHRGMIFARNRRRVKWHSYSPGIGFLDLVVSRFVPEAITYRFIEPIVVFAVGVMLAGVDATFGYWWKFGALAMAIQRQIDYINQRNAYLNMIDGQIESQEMNAVLIENKPLKETSGFTLVAADRNMPVEEKKDLMAMLKGIDPSLQSAMNDVKQVASG